MDVTTSAATYVASFVGYLSFSDCFDISSLESEINGLISVKTRGAQAAEFLAEVISSIVSSELVCVISSQFILSSPCMYPYSRLLFYPLNFYFILFI